MKFRLQSAMEYLMTYGWAILIIAVVLGALFALGVFGGNTLGTTCVAQSGYLCQNPIYSHATGNFVVTVGQSTGTNWDNVAFGFQPQSVPVPSNGVPSFPDGLTANIAVLGTGQTQSEDVPVSGVVAPGTTQSGTLWAEYQINGNTYYAQIATVTMKAV